MKSHYDTWLVLLTVLMLGTSAFGANPAKELENLESGRKKLKLGLGRKNAEIPTRSTQEGRMLLQ